MAVCLVATALCRRVRRLARSRTAPQRRGYSAKSSHDLESWLLAKCDFIRADYWLLLNPRSTLPMIAPVPVSATRSLPVFKYGLSACARFASGSDCSQTRPGPRQRGQENAVAAEEHVSDAGDARDAEVYTRLEHPDVPRMHPQRLARAEVIWHDLAAEFDPRLPLAGELLQQKSVAAENSRAE